MIRAALAGALAAAMLAGVLGLIAAFAPTVIYHPLLRFFIAFAVCWLIVQVVERFGGASGWPFTALAVVLAFAVMFSNLAATALHSPQPGGMSPSSAGSFAFLMINFTALGGILAAAWFARDE